MKITVDIPPEVEVAMQTHIARALIVETIDGKPTNIPQFATIEKFLESVLTPVFDYVVKEYPSVAVRIKLNQIRTVENELHALLKATVVIKEEV